jgi:hypothetical protein
MVHVSSGIVTMMSYSAGRALRGTHSGAGSCAWPAAIVGMRRTVLAWLTAESITEHSARVLLHWAWPPQETVGETQPLRASSDPGGGGWTGGRRAGRRRARATGRAAALQRLPHTARVAGGRMGRREGAAAAAEELAAVAARVARAHRRAPLSAAGTAGGGGRLGPPSSRALSTTESRVQQVGLIGPAHRVLNAPPAGVAVGGTGGRRDGA